MTLLLGECGGRTLGITRLLCILLLGERVLERLADPQILTAYNNTVTPFLFLVSFLGCDLPLLGGVQERRQTLGLFYLLGVFWTTSDISLLVFIPRLF